MAIKLSYVPSTALVVTGIAYFMVFLTDAPHERAYAILIATITITTAVCSVSLRLADCSRGNEDSEDVYRRIGEGLLGCVLNVASVLVLTYACDLLAGPLHVSVLRYWILSPLLIIASGKFLTTLMKMGCILRILSEMLEGEDCYTIGNERHVFQRATGHALWCYVISAAFVLGLAREWSLPFHVPETTMQLLGQPSPQHKRRERPIDSHTMDAEPEAGQILKRR